MIESITRKMEKASREIGLDVRLPRPSRKSLAVASKGNLIVGASALGIGLISETKWALLIGGTALVSGLLMKSEARKRV